MQTRQGVIDFSTSTKPYPLLFGTNQGIDVGGGTLNLLGGLKVINGDLTLQSSSTNGVRFPDNSLQATAASGLLGYGKICSMVSPGYWRDSLEVPDSFRRSGCKAYATAIGAPVAYPGCITSSSVWLATADSGVPSPNCGWDVPPPKVIPPPPKNCADPVWTGTRWICPGQCTLPQYWKCPLTP